MTLSPDPALETWVDNYFERTRTDVPAAPDLRPVEPLGTSGAAR